MLDFSKLLSLLETKGFAALNFFVYEKMVFAIEVLNLKSADIFLLYINSKYDFTLSTDKENVFELKTLGITGKSGNITQDYGNVVEPDSFINLDVSLGKIEEQLEGAYKKAIKIGDIPEEDLASLKSVYRQVYRLRYCVLNIKYKLCIFLKNYVCMIRRDDSIDCYCIKNYPKISKRKILVIIDLETFYEVDTGNLSMELETIRNTIYSMLERTQISQATVIENLVKSARSISEIPSVIDRKKVEYDNMIQKMRKMMDSLIAKESKCLTEIQYVEKMESGSLQKDMEKASKKTSLLKDLERIVFLKSEVSKNMILVREKRENRILNIDTVSFDNAVMLDSLIKNFEKMREYI